MLTLMAGLMKDDAESVFADVDRIRPAFGHICFCADDKHVEDLVDQGHIDQHVRQAIRLGVPVDFAYRMATWNAALYYRLDRLIGATSPARLADLQVIGDLDAVRPELVIVGGTVVAREGVRLFDNTEPVPEFLRDTIHLAPTFAVDDLSVAADAPAVWVLAMEMYDGYFKRAFHAEPPVVDGNVVSEPASDVLLVVLGSLCPKVRVDMETSNLHNVHILG